MGLVWLRSRAELRARWRTAVVLALLLGVGGGVSLTAFAGARRADGAMGEFVAYSLPDDGGFLYGNPNAPPPVPGQAANSLALAPLEQRVVDLPQVVAYFRAPYLFVTPDRTAGAGRTLNVTASGEAALFRRVDRPLVLAGRLPSPKQPFEGVVNELAAEQRHLHVGSPVRLYAYSVAQIQTLTGSVETGQTVPAGPSFTVRVAAIVRSPEDVNAVLPLATKEDVSYEGQQYLYLSPAFLPRLAASLGVPVNQLTGINLVGVRLRHGAADWAAFSAAARRIGGSRIFTSPGNVYSVHKAASSAQRGIHIEVVGLLIFGVLAALVSLLFVGQVAARQTVLESEDYARLRTLGMTRRQLLAIVTVRTGVVGFGGAALAFVIAVFASPLMPIGLARQAEIHPGIDLDPAILVPGAVVLVAALTAWSVFAGWRVARRSPGYGDRSVRPSWLGSLWGRRSVPPTVGIGVRFGLDPGRGSGAVPVASAIAGAALAVATLTASVVFGTSLGHLDSSPRQQGWNWNVLVGNPNDLNDRIDQVGKILAHNPLVGSYSAIAILAGANQGSAVIDGKVINLLLAFDPLKGSVYPPLIVGHAPRSINEIVLGQQTLHQLSKHVGQSVRIATQNGPKTLRIVGEMIAPSVGDLFTNGLGEGGWVYGPAIRRQLAEQASTSSSATPPTVFDLFAVRYAPGVSPAAGYASLRREFGRTVLRQLPSEDVINLESVDKLPLVLSGLVVLLGIATIANALVSSVRRRRRELAILKTMGFTRRQVATVVAWQATTFCGAALVIGIPVGITGGSWAWRLVAASIGSASPVVLPVLVIVLTVPVALVLGNAVAAAPGWVASRIAPAAVLRAR